MKSSEHISGPCAGNSRGPRPVRSHTGCAAWRRWPWMITKAIHARLPPRLLASGSGACPQITASTPFGRSQRRLGPRHRLHDARRHPSPPVRRLDRLHQ